jgi:hypothetical protein
MQSVGDWSELGLRVVCARLEQWPVGWKADRTVCERLAGHRMANGMRMGRDAYGTGRMGMGKVGKWYERGWRDAGKRRSDRWENGWNQVGDRQRLHAALGRQTVGARLSQRWPIHPSQGGRTVGGPGH